MKNKGVLPEKDMRKMSGREYVNWLTDYLVYEDEEQPVRKLTEKEKHHLAQYSGLEQLTGRDATHITEPTQQGDGWKLGLVLTVIAVIVIVALILMG